MFRRTKREPVVAAELPDRIDELDHCTMTPEQIGLYQAVLDSLVGQTGGAGGEPKKGAILAAIMTLFGFCSSCKRTVERATERWIARRKARAARRQLALAAA